MKRETFNTVRDVAILIVAGVCIFGFGFIAGSQSHEVDQYLIDSMIQARDSHQNFVDNPIFVERINQNGFFDLTLKGQEEWVRIYSEVVKELEAKDGR